MSPELDAFRAGYAKAFQTYLASGEESGLELAYELGREAATGDLSLLELAGIHHDVLADCLEHASGPSEFERISRAGAAFFLESLSTFEMAQRGFLEASETARLEQRHAAQLRGLADAALAVNSTLSEDEALALLSERARAIVGAERCEMSLLTAEGGRPTAPARGAGRLSAPLIDGKGRAIGRVELSGKREGEFSADDESILVQLAQMTSVAIAKARLYEHERGIAATLQENLLPADLPEVAGVSAKARYLAGGAGVDVGGDWYELIPLPGGRVGLAIGDVVGRGVRAAAMMGQLRVALRAYALESDSPALVAQRVAHFVRSLESGQMGTGVYGVLEPRTGELRFANAGHPPPLMLSDDGTASLLDGRPGLPFGVVGDFEYTESRTTISPGSTLLLYTDGLVERRGEPIDVGLERLRRTAAGAPVDPDPLCQRLLEALVQEGPADDVALLAVHALALDRESLELVLRADPTVLGDLRRRLRAWLAGAGASAEEGYDIVLAACEAAANAIEHAYGPREASFRLTAHVVEGEVTLEVRDRGTWRKQRDPRRGRGLRVMRQAMDAVEVKSAEEGTNVRMRRKLGDGAPDGRAGADPD